MVFTGRCAEAYVTNNSLLAVLIMVASVFHLFLQARVLCQSVLYFFWGVGTSTAPYPRRPSACIFSLSVTVNNWRTDSTCGLSVRLCATDMTAVAHDRCVPSIERKSSQRSNDEHRSTLVCTSIFLRNVNVDPLQCSIVRV